MYLYPEDNKIYNRFYYLQNRNWKIQLASNWQKEHPELRREINRKYMQSEKGWNYHHSERVILQKKITSKHFFEIHPNYKKHWNETHPNYMKHWHETHPNYYKHYSETHPNRYKHLRLRKKIFNTFKERKVNETL